MDQGKYIILRELGAPDTGDPYSRSPSPYERRGTRGTRGAQEVGHLRVDVETLDKRDISDHRRDPEVKSIAPSIPIKLPTKINEAIYVEKDVEAPSVAGETWGVVVTGATDSPYTGKGVAVAVLDTGINAKHEAFQGLQLVEEDFTGEGNGDENGHGTHCAGTIFGQAINGYRFSVAPGVEKALIGKVLNRKGNGSTGQIVSGIQWALDKGAHIISVSLGMDFPGLVAQLIEEHNYPEDFAAAVALESYRANVRLFDKLVALVQARGLTSPFEPAIYQPTVIIAAAGNESQRWKHPNYELAVAPPAAADGVISVGALETAGEPHDALTVAGFSNTGPNVCAPGVNIYSANTKGGYVEKSGTSMATPHVAGIAALWFEKLLGERGRVDVRDLAALVVGRATENRLAKGFDPLDIGRGLVQAPLS